MSHFRLMPVLILFAFAAMFCYGLHKNHQFQEPSEEQVQLKVISMVAQDDKRERLLNQQDPDRNFVMSDRSQKLRYQNYELRVRKHIAEQKAEINKFMYGGGIGFLIMFVIVQLSNWLQRRAGN